MFNAYTPLQYIQPTVQNTTQYGTPVQPVDITQSVTSAQPIQYVSPAQSVQPVQQNTVAPVQYNSQLTPVGYSCAVDYNSPTVKGITPPKIGSAVISPMPVKTTIATTQVNTPAPVVNAPIQEMNRATISVAKMGALDNGWSDTNQVRIDNNINVVSFEFIENTFNIATRSANTSKSDEIAHPYYQVEEARTIVNNQLDKVSNINTVKIELKRRTENQSFVRVLFSYYQDIDANTFHTFDGYLTIYSDNDNTLDLISDMLSADLKLGVSTKQSLFVTPKTVNTTKMSTPMNTMTTMNPINSSPYSTSSSVYSTGSSPFTTSKYSPRSFISDYQ